MLHSRCSDTRQGEFQMAGTLRASLAILAVVLVSSTAGADVKQGLSALEKKDYGAAAKQFSTAFEAGEADGAFYLGRMMELGFGGPANLKSAVALYLAGSAKGSPQAKNRLGVLHIEGKGVLQDYQQGAKLVCEAAELKDQNGQFNCGTLLLEGKGVEKNEKLAYDWFSKASDQGHLGAKNQYALALMEGKYVSRDIDKAVQLFQQTAAKGNPLGLFSIAQAFATGLGAEKDVVKAHAYFNIASALGHPQAADARKTVEKSMKQPQIVEAQQLARAWRPEKTTPK